MLQLLKLSKQHILLNKPHIEPPMKLLKKKENNVSLLKLQNIRDSWLREEDCLKKDSSTSGPLAQPDAQCSI
jgi:hypothetical protein